jgi:hypothetical protein
MRFEGLSYGELLVLSKALLMRIRQLDGQLRMLDAQHNRDKWEYRGKETERAICYEILIEIGNLRQDHTEVDKVIEMEP